MWLFPGLSIVVVVAILAVLVQMGLTKDTRPQLVLSLLAWALVLVFYAVTRWRGGSVEPEAAPAVPGAGAPERVLVLANETVAADELLDELRRIDESGRAEYFVCVPANPVDTGQAEHKGAVWVWDATVQAAQRRLDYTLGVLRSEGFRADGALGDYRPMHALQAAVTAFRPDQLVISTHPEEHSTWLRHGVVQKARHVHSLPVTHVVSHVRPAVAP
jgi:GABA permease